MLLSEARDIRYFVAIDFFYETMCEQTVEMFLQKSEVRQYRHNDTFVLFTSFCFLLICLFACLFVCLFVCLLFFCSRTLKNECY